MDEIEIRADLTLWDTAEVYPDGFDAPPGKPDDITSLLTKVGECIATGGLVFTLPGATPTQAIVITCHGPGDGAVVAGSVDYHHQPD